MTIVRKERKSIVIIDVVLSSTMKSRIDLLATTMVSVNKTIDMQKCTFERLVDGDNQTHIAICMIVTNMWSKFEKGRGPWSSKNLQQLIRADETTIVCKK